jgi:Uma2 family endonuclease
MATKAQVTAEQHLHMTFDYDAEFVHGEIVERAVPNYSHGRIQTVLSSMFDAVRTPVRSFGGSAVRMRIAPEIYRIPDVAAFVAPPGRAIPEPRPLVVVEILSPGDGCHALRDYPLELTPAVLFSDL